MAKRQELSLQETIEVLDKVKKKKLTNSSQRELAEIFKIPRSTLTRLINRKKNLGHVGVRSSVMVTSQQRS